MSIFREPQYAVCTMSPHSICQSQLCDEFLIKLKNACSSAGITWSYNIQYQILSSQSLKWWSPLVC